MSDRYCLHCSGLLKKKQTKFCSKQCHDASQVIIRHCLQCMARLTKPDQKKFCGLRCRVAHNKKDDDIRVYPLKVRVQIAQLWEQGLTGGQIAQKLHLRDRGVVHKLRERMGLPPRKAVAKPMRHQPPRLMIHLEREIHGPEPLPPMHPISWGAIAL